MISFHGYDIASYMCELPKLDLLYYFSSQLESSWYIDFLHCLQNSLHIGNVFWGDHFPQKLTILNAIGSCESLSEYLYKDH